MLKILVHISVVDRVRRGGDDGCWVGWSDEHKQIEIEIEVVLVCETCSEQSLSLDPYGLSR